MNQKMFSSIEAAASYLMQETERSIMLQLQKHDAAILILPGGKSIVDFFPYLAKLDLPWVKITIALSDERSVCLDHDMSNERQLREYFLRYVPNAKYQPLSMQLVTELQKIEPITILSMGTDGHVASLFPEEYQDWKSMGMQVYRTKQQNPARISLTLESILNSAKIFLLVIGKQKNEFVTQKLTNAFPLHELYEKSNLIRCIND
jgi:6-phosphogluconolactonase/glucosamine-6-phosphate isomerase/deaminase